MIEIANAVIGTLLLVAFCYFAFVSFLDEEKRAATVSLLFALTVPIPFLAVSSIAFPHRSTVGVVLIVLTAALVLLLTVPVRGRRRWGDESPRNRIDERDIMFSRRLLEPGTERFAEYYTRNPDKKSWDDKFRYRPGLLATGAAQYDPISFNAAAASFDTIEKLRPHVEGKRTPERIETDETAITEFIKSWVIKLGGHSVGVARLRDYHKYSVVGRGPDYGQSVTLDHEFAIALTVEMDKGLMDTGPKGPTVMESAQKYVDSGAIAVQVAKFIGYLGYDARAHIDGNYRVVCPLVARDAGLGEIGRLGLLMTPDLGPRVRIAVITTNLELVPDRREPEDSVLDFCTHCRKCATCCPPWAIPFEDRVEIDGVQRWQINQELCYIYWSHVGTDCGRCVSVCPYSHPDRLVHKLVRLGIRRSAIFRRFAIAMDSLFYGKKPAATPLPEWVRAAADTARQEFS